MDCDDFCGIESVEDRKAAALQKSSRPRALNGAQTSPAGGSRVPVDPPSTRTPSQAGVPADPGMPTAAPSQDSTISLLDKDGAFALQEEEELTKKMALARKRFWSTILLLVILILLAIFLPLWLYLSRTNQLSRMQEDFQSKIDVLGDQLEEESQQGFLLPDDNNDIKPVDSEPKKAKGQKMNTPPMKGMGMEGSKGSARPSDQLGSDAPSLVPSQSPSGILLSLMEPERESKGKKSQGEERGTQPNAGEVNPVLGSDVPTLVPSHLPSAVLAERANDGAYTDSDIPSDWSSSSPSQQPSTVSADSDVPIDWPSSSPSQKQFTKSADSDIPSDWPSSSPSQQPPTVSVDSDIPSDWPSSSPSQQPSTVSVDSDVPSDWPSSSPSQQPSTVSADSDVPSDWPSSSPSQQPSTVSAKIESEGGFQPHFLGSDYPSLVPSSWPEPKESTEPRHSGSTLPSDAPSIVPSQLPSSDLK